MNKPLYSTDPAVNFGFQERVREPEFCCFCGRELNRMISNDARPVKDAKCCDYCNFTIVVPERIKQCTGGEENVTDRSA